MTPSSPTNTKRASAGRRALHTGGPWLFDRPESGGATMLWQLEPCPRRTCPCRSVDIRVTEVTRPLEAYSEESRKLHVWFVDGTESKPSSFLGKVGTLLRRNASAGDALPAHEVSVDFQTAAVTPRTEAFPPALGDRIVSELDGTVLDALYDEFRAAQRFDVRTEPKNDFPNWERGQLLQWHEAYPDARQDWLVTDHGTFTVRDYHCVRPNCTCSKAVVSFFRVDGDARVFVGRVTLRGEKATAKRFEPGGIAERELRDLLSRYRARHDLPALFAARTRHLAETLGPGLYGAATR